jgi:outer membrane receptor protein involved in Fe transport
MGEARPWKNWIFQTGLRYEYTSQEAVTLIPMSIQMVERELGTRDHYTQRFLSMLYKNGERTTTTNDYSFLLPSASVKYNFTPNLSGHLGYSEGFGRLSVEKLAANWKIIESATRNAARAPNPSLEPDHYKTYSAAFEYYFEPAGSFTITYTYRQWMGTTYDELIIENPNLDSPTPVLKTLIDMYGAETLRGFMDMDYEIVTWQPSEVNDRAMQTLELSYRQRIPAIPGLQIDANFTRNVPNWRKTGAASAPKIASGGVSYSNRNFYLRVSGNWRSRYWQSWSTAADLDLKQRVGVNARFLLNAEVTYRLTRWLSFYTRVDNILNAPTSQYRYSSNIVSQETLAGVAFRIGVKGDF